MERFLPAGSVMGADHCSQPPILWGVVGKSTPHLHFRGSHLTPQRARDSLNKGRKVRGAVGPRRGFREESVHRPEWRNEQRAVPPMSSAQEPSDEELMQQLARGREEVLGILYRRHASSILNRAAHSLDRSAAEEIVQDVFLSVWRHAAVFTPQRGTFRAWLMQMARYRILNELRRRDRRPRLGPDPNDLLLGSLPDNGPEPAEAF